MPQDDDGFLTAIQDKGGAEPQETVIIWAATVIIWAATVIIVAQPLAGWCGWRR